MQGEDNYDDLYEEFRQDLIRVEELDMDQLDSLKKQAYQLQQKVDTFLKKPNRWDKVATCDISFILFPPTCVI
jgi:hypothetical protein